MKIPGLPRICFVPVECKRFLLKRGCTKVGQEDVPRRRGRWKKFLVHSRSLFRSDLSLERVSGHFDSEHVSESQEVIVSRSQLLLALFSNFPTCIGVMANTVKVTEFDRLQHELDFSFSKTIVQLRLELSDTAAQCNVRLCLV